MENSPDKPVSPQVPWWFTVLPIASLTLQLASECVRRYLDSTSLDVPIDFVKIEVPVPRIGCETTELNGK